MYIWLYVLKNERDMRSREESELQSQISELQGTLSEQHARLQEYYDHMREQENSIVTSKSEIER